MRHSNYGSDNRVAIVTTPTKKADLQYNFLQFEWPLAAETHYFGLHEVDGARKLHKNAFPKELSKVFSETELAAGCIYTTYGYKQEGYKAVAVKVCGQNLDFSRKVLQRKLKWFFKKKAEMIVEPGFIENIIVWEYLEEQQAHTPYVLFDKFSIQVKLLHDKQNKPCILISYEGTGKLLKDNTIAALKKVNNVSDINKVLDKRSIRLYKDYLAAPDAELKDTFPVLGGALAKAYPVPANCNKPHNKYHRYKTKIDHFFKSYINTPAFKKEFPLASASFIKVPASCIGHVDGECNRLFYGSGNDTAMPKYKFRHLKPAVKVTAPVTVFFIYHKNDKDTMEKWKQYMKHGKGHHYPGLAEFASISCHFHNQADIVFDNLTNPIPEIEAAFEKYNYQQPGIKFLALYVTPFSREETRQQERRVMPLVKELLLKQNIVIQAAEPANINRPDFQWSLTTMSTTIVYKLGGIPWQLKQFVRQELVIGISAFKDPIDGVSYCGASVLYNNSGNLKTTAWFEKDDIKAMAGYMATLASDYAATYGKPERLIIHFYKKLKRDEIEIIEKKLQALELPYNIPVFIVAINKTEETDFVAFDIGRPDLLMPETGTYIKIYNNEYLLFNNSRVGNTHNANDHYHFPIKLHLQCNKHADIDETTTKELIEQVYQFSKLNYRTLSQQNLPITLLAIDLMADFVPYFKDKNIPDGAESIPWWP